MRLTEAEWQVMEVLWNTHGASLKEVTDTLARDWNKKTVHTYLKRMSEKGIVAYNRSSDRPYKAAVSREECAREERADLLQRVYRGNADELVTAFLKETKISSEERDRLRRLLDEMEV